MSPSARYRIVIPVLMLLVVGAALAASSAASPAPDTATVSRLALMSGKDVLRVRGSFGEFAGRVTTIDEHGLDGFRVEPRHDPTGKPPAAALTWEQVTTIDRLGTQSRHYAGVGAIVAGGLLGTLAAIFANGNDDSASQVAAGFMLGASAGIVVGAGAGALIGMNVHAWHPEYPTRSH